MNDSAILWWLVLLWLFGAVGAVHLRMRRGQASSGLVLAYVISLGAISCLAPAMYLFPDHFLSGYDGLVRGMRICTFSMLAFALGVLLWELRRPWMPVRAERTTQAGLRDIPQRLLLLAGAAYALTYTWVGSLPTVTALLSAASAVLSLAIVWKLYLAYRRHARWEFTGWFCVVAFFPFLTTAAEGFLGFGAGIVVLISCHVVGFARKRSRLLPAGLILAYLGLSVYVTYMRDRSDIRETVWGGMPLSVRLEQISTTFRGFEWFDPTDALHEQLVDNRLNQTRFIGLAERNLEAGTVDFARGGTIWEAVVALVPRAVWPEKPVFAGSRGIVTQYTGITFGAWTSVGATQVLESYINFGEPGVVAVFLLFGFLLAAADTRAGEALRAGDLEKFLQWSLPAVALLNVGGSFVEISASAGANFALFWILKVLGVFEGGRPRPSRTVPADGPPEPGAPMPRGAVVARAGR